MKRKFLFLFFIFISLSINCFSNIIPYKENKIQKENCELAVCCVFQNEAEWLKEWIEFHRLIGVDHFYLYNNLSTDNYLEILSPYIEKGIIELFDFPVSPFKNTHQAPLYNHALKLSLNKNKWLTAIDTDEFITPMHFTSLKEYLKDNEAYAGIYIKWQTFGTSSVKNLKKKELLIEKLVFKAPPDNVRNTFGKTILQPLLATRFLNPHWALYPENYPVHNPDYNEIRVNHYFVRTEDYLYNYKIPRIKKWNVSAFNERTLIKYMGVANSTYDDSMERFVLPLKNILFP